MKKYRIGICGHLDRTVHGENGQTMKTISVSNELKTLYGDNQVVEVSTHAWKKKPFSLFINIFNLSRCCKNILMFPDANGVKVILPIFLFFSKFFNNRLIYSVQGAWLPDMLKKHKRLRRKITKIDYVVVETKTLQNSLENLGLQNISILKNFKRIIPVEETLIDNYKQNGLRLCFFSRVTKEKGILDAIHVLKRAKQENPDFTFQFDIYGPCSTPFKEVLYECIGDFDCIKYIGEIDAYKSVSIIRNYHFQLFPTLYSTEGIPGSVIDSFFAGVPVIASIWDSCFDVLKPCVNSLVFKQGSLEEFYNVIKQVINMDFDDYLKMREASLKESKLYTPSECIKVLSNVIL